MNSEIKSRHTQAEQAAFQAESLARGQSQEISQHRADADLITTEARGDKGEIEVANFRAHAYRAVLATDAPSTTQLKALSRVEAAWAMYLIAQAIRLELVVWLRWWLKLDVLNLKEAKRTQKLVHMFSSALGWMVRLAGRKVIKEAEKITKPQECQPTALRKANLRERHLQVVRDDEEPVPGVAYSTPPPQSEPVLKIVL